MGVREGENVGGEIEEEQGQRGGLGDQRGGGTRRLQPVQEDLGVAFTFKQKVKIPLRGGVFRTDPASVFSHSGPAGLLELPQWEEPLGFAEGGIRVG